MTDSARSALRLALRLADPATADALAERMRPELLAALAQRFGLPGEMVAELAGPQAAGLQAALSADTEEFLMAAAETGDPAIGRALWNAGYRRSTLPVVLGAADPLDPRWTEEDGLIPVLQDEAAAPDLLPALTCAFPELVGYATLLLAPFLPPPVVLDGCIALAVLGGGEALAAFARIIEETPQLGDLGHPWAPALLRQAADAPGPEAFLRERRPAGEWSDPEQVRVLLALRNGDGPLAPPDGLDWDLIRREHERLPFGRETRRGPGFREGSRLFQLARWEGCPADLVLESYREDPDATAGYAAELPFEALTGPGEAHRWNRWTLLQNVLGRGIRAGWLPVDRVLAEVAPAEAVLEALPYDHEPTRKALADLLARLGTDPVNWLTCYARIGRARGSVADLIADAAAPATRKKRYASWPRPAEAEFPAVRPASPRSAFLRMFRCASEEAQISVVPHFDARAVQHLLVHGDPSPAVRAAVVAAHGLPAQVAMAAAEDLSAEQLDYLLDLDEPEVDAQLFRHGGLDRAERKRLLAGRLRGGGTRPVPEGLLAVLAGVGIGHHRDWLTAGLESGDLGVARQVIGRLRLHVPASRLRPLVAVGERGGPEAVREILALDRLPVTLRRRTEQLLDAPDGLAQLRALLAEEESEARLLAYLTTSGGRPRERLHRLRSEGMEPPWPALLEANGAGALPADLLGALAEHPQCPRALLLTALACTPETRAVWIQEALQRGTLTPEDLLTRAAPARAALDCLLRYTDDRPDTPDRRPVRDRAEALTREHLGVDVEAWAVCLQLLPTFAGTLPELVATAGAVAQMPG